jgi:hypothetical protein
MNELNFIIEILKKIPNGWYKNIGLIIFGFILGLVLISKCYKDNPQVIKEPILKHDTIIVYKTDSIYIPKEKIKVKTIIKNNRI